jgi:hypothetical protein
MDKGDELQGSAARPNKSASASSSVTPAKTSPAKKAESERKSGKKPSRDILWSEVIKETAPSSKKRPAAPSESAIRDQAQKAAKTALEAQMREHLELERRIRGAAAELPEVDHIALLGPSEEKETTVWDRFKELHEKVPLAADREEITWSHVFNGDWADAGTAVRKRAEQLGIDMRAFKIPPPHSLHKRNLGTNIPVLTLERWFQDYLTEKRKREDEEGWERAFLQEKEDRLKALAPKKHGWESSEDESPRAEKTTVSGGAANTQSPAPTVKANSQRPQTRAENAVLLPGVINPQQIVLNQQLECLQSITNTTVVKTWCEKVTLAYTGNVFQRDIRELISPSAQTLFNDRLECGRHPQGDWQWLQLPALEVVKLLRTIVVNAQPAREDEKLATRLREWDYNLDVVPTVDLSSRFGEALIKLVDQFGERYVPPEEEQASCIAALELYLKKAARKESPGKRFGSYLFDQYENTPKEERPKTVDAFRRWCARAIYEAAQTLSKSEKILGRSLKKDNFQQRDSSSSKQQPQQQQKQKKDGAICNGCGRFVRAGQVCQCGPHPDRNKNPNITFAESASFRAQKARGYQYDMLDLKRRADGSPLSAEEAAAIEKAKPLHTGGNSKPSDKKKDFKKKGELSLNAISTSDIPAVTEFPLLEPDINLPVFSIFSPFGDSKQVKTLVDSGSLQACFISEEIAAWLTEKGGKRKREQVLISLAAENAEASSSSSFKFDVEFINEVNNQKELISALNAFVLQSNYDLIIGLPIIQKYSLANKLPSFFNEGISAPILALARRPDGSPVHTEPRCVELGDHPRAALQATKSRVQLYAIPKVLDSKDLIDEYDDSDYIEWPDNPFDARPEDVNNEHFVDRIDIQGPAGLQEKLRSLCTEFPEIFLEKVQAEPARVTPMSIEVDESTWKTSKHRGPPRIQCKSKEDEIDKQITNYLKLGVIRPCKVAEVSQVHLVPKPDPNEWRFCLDFVQLNKSTKGIEGWPIPNISQLLNRIGTRRAQYFGIMDLTSGYHQAPIDKASQEYTAFTCFRGVYCWLRVPMGLKNAASYFQRVMATEVLVGLIHVLCELYIDDILSFGKDEEEYVANLRKVFTRLREHNVCNGSRIFNNKSTIVI